MSNHADTIRDLYAKIEAEFRKPLSNQNGSLLAFWQEKLDKLEAQQQNPGKIYYRQASHLQFHCETDSLVFIFVFFVKLRTCGRHFDYKIA